MVGEFPEDCSRYPIRSSTPLRPSTSKRHIDKVGSDTKRLQGSQTLRNRVSWGQVTIILSEHRDELLVERLGFLRIVKE